MEKAPTLGTPRLGALPLSGRILPFYLVISDYSIVTVQWLSLIHICLEHSRYSLGMEDRALFLGFAETATGLARAVADCFDGEMAYISTCLLYTSK